MIPERRGESQTDIESEESVISNLVGKDPLVTLTV
jgi:hypothetical protein